ncbi:unnamed protein product, partial [Prorocentrum cordatum]
RVASSGLGRGRVPASHRRPVLIDGLVDEGWPGFSWSAEEWAERLAGVPLPARRLSAVAARGALGAAREVPGEAYLGRWDSSAGDEREDGQDATVVFSTSASDAAMVRLRALGVVREPPPLLRAVQLYPVLSIGRADEGLPFHQHE